jgi:hypothetical protein
MVAGSSNYAGFTGYDIFGKYNCCFWNKTTSGMTDGVGDVNPDPSGVTGLTSEQFSNQASFSCFDFNRTWMMAGDKPVLTALTIPTLTEWTVIIFIGLLAVLGDGLCGDESLNP